MTSGLQLEGMTLNGRELTTDADRIDFALSVLMFTVMTARDNTLNSNDPIDKKHREMYESFRWKIADMAAAMRDNGY